MKILLDSSFLITAVKYKIDIFNELKGNELVVLDCVNEELEKLIKGGKKGKFEAKIVLELLKKNKIKIKKSDIKEADDALISEEGAVATQDKELKGRLKGRKIITIRQKKFLIGV